VGVAGIPVKVRDSETGIGGSVAGSLEIIGNGVDSCAFFFLLVSNNQDGVDSGHLLKQADIFGILPQDRELPLPSAFMETVRKLGAEYNIIIPPVDINAAEEQNLLH